MKRKEPRLQLLRDMMVKLDTGCRKWEAERDARDAIGDRDVAGIAQLAVPELDWSHADDGNSKDLMLVQELPMTSADHVAALMQQ